MAYQQNRLQQKTVIASESERYHFSPLSLSNTPLLSSSDLIGGSNDTNKDPSVKPKDDIMEQPDRFTPLLKYANELGKTHISENKRARQRQWTPDKRAQQRQIINDNKPWLHSTGAKTTKGKRTSSQNALKHGLRSVEFAKLQAALHQITAYRRRIHAQTWETIRDLHEIHATRRLMEKPTLGQITQEMHSFFKEGGVTVSKNEIKRMVKEATGLTESDYITAPDTEITDKQAETLRNMADRRAKGEPLTRIIGETEFWGLPFKVTSDVLDPRPDTETLVEAVLKHTLTRFSLHSNHPLPKGEGGATQSGEGEGIRILDLGTGSGCIPIALLTELPHATAFAVDYSFAAAQVARENAMKNNVADRFHVIQGDWMAALKPHSFDIITSNPPYIVESDIADLMPEVKNHDPILALSGGKNGLECYKKIILQLKIHLHDQNMAFLEIGFGQLAELQRLSEDSNLTLCDSKADIAGIPRVVEIRRGDK